MTGDDQDGYSSDVLDARSPTRKLSNFPMQHIVTVCTAPIKDGGTVPRVDVYITFTGQCNDTSLHGQRGTRVNKLFVKCQYLGTQNLPSHPSLRRQFESLFIAMPHL